MRLKKDGFVASTAYFFSDGNAPFQTSLCLLFWRFILSGLGLIVFAIIVGVLAGFGYAVGLFVAARPCTPESSEAIPLRQYHHWPRVGGRRVWPIGIIGAFLLGWLIPGINWLLVVAWILPFIPLVSGGATVLIIIAIIVTWINEARRAEATALVGAWLKAKKERVCPIVEFIDSEPITQ